MSNCKENKEEICKSYPLCYGCNSFKKPTNYDRIRNMSVEEIANMMFKLSDCEIRDCKNCPLGSCQHCGNIEEIKKWLESEALTNGKY